ncbi:MAG: radical SAM protein [Myxococcales bacterium]|nr:radical SAM protein [Myxococcales bacterium]
MEGRRVDVARGDFYPAYVVWELTLACDHACAHCGSRAGRARERELSLDEALDVVAQLADAGTRECVLIGGEAYLYEGYLTVLRALADAGIRPLMTSGGRGLSAARCAEMKAHGLFAVSVSVDGLEASHDRIRARRGSHAAALRAIDNAVAAGLRVSCNTNVNALNEADLEALYELLRDAGVTAWQVQLTAPLGRAADHVEMLLQPAQLLDVVPRVVELKRRGFDDGVLLMPGNNLGYFGPGEATLRSQDLEASDHWQGCQAGRYVMGIESDGAIKGCPSLQTASYVGGNISERPLAEIWRDSEALAFARARSVADLWGFCRECPFAETCLGGCTFTAHALLGRPGNNPYCHFRATEMHRRGLVERLVLVEAAPGRPFDNGRFEIVVDTLA